VVHIQIELETITEIEHQDIKNENLNIIINYKIFHLYINMKNLSNNSTHNNFLFNYTDVHVDSRSLAVGKESLNKNEEKGVYDNACIKFNTNTPSVNQKIVYNFRGKTVLVVDDVSFNLNLIELYFRNTGATILFAGNGKEAIDACISNPQVNIVLMDIQMPVMNGLDATLEIRKQKPGMPVIAITAFVHPNDKQRCLDAGCVDFLPKPCSREDLLRTVRNFIH
jgi:CheY-like chemotaxis protein